MPAPPTGTAPTSSAYCSALWLSFGMGDVRKRLPRRHPSRGLGKFSKRNLDWQSDSGGHKRLRAPGYRLEVGRSARLLAAPATPQVGPARVPHPDSGSHLRGLDAAPEDVRGERRGATP